MLKIGFLTVDVTDATSFYRGVGPLSALEKAYKLEVHQLQNAHLDWNDLASFDIIFLQRPHSDIHLHIAQLTKLMKKRLWVDFDDNLFHVDFSNAAALYYQDNATRSRLAKLLELADYVTTSTPLIKEAMSAYQESHKIEVIPNALMSNLIGEVVRRKPIRRNRIINWRGTEHHIEYLMAFKEQILRLAKYNERFCFQFMNHKPWYLMQELQDRANFVPGKSIIDYAFHMYKSAPWMQIVPMTVSNFSASKSNIAWIESIMYAGAPVVAPYLPEWAEKPGCFTYKDSKDFLRVCQQVLDMKEEDLEKTVHAARIFIKDQLDIFKVNELRLDIIKRMVPSETLI